jgi:hypothetical protein
MRKVFVTALLGALVTVGVATAVAGNAIESRTKIKGVYLANPDGTLGVDAKLKTKPACKSAYRDYVLFDQDGKVTKTEGQNTAFIASDEIAIGDTIQVKAKSVRIDRDVKCGGSISEEYEITELTPLP